MKNRNSDNPEFNNQDFKVSRRRMLRSLGGITLGASVLGLLPPNVRKALANPPRSGGSLQDIKHVVLLMQENRSFDHYFGSLSGVRGFDDPHAMKLENGRSVFYQPDPQNPDGYLLPFHLDTRKTSAQKIPSTNHSWPVQHAAWNHGKMDSFVTAHLKAQGDSGQYTMGYYTRQDLPFHYALADAFTICDGFHCSVLGPTFPNRLYWLSGMIDPKGQYGGPAISNKIPPGGFRWTSYAERLQEAGISWRAYQDKSSWSMLYSFFKAFRDADKDKNSPLYKRGVEQSPVSRFEYDAMTDNLPTVSWIFIRDASSEHPPDLPAVGASFIASKIDAIAANPKVWAKTVFILNYDENDGLFDHVAPPVPHSGTPGEFVNGEPIGAGFRVPCIIVSPWTTGGWVSSELFDHTSILQLLEKVTGVEEPNISRWRRDTFGDLTSVFRFGDKMTKPPVLGGTLGQRNLAEYEASQLPHPVIPKAHQSRPRQEPGKRKHVR